MNKNMRTKRALGLVLVIVSILLVGTQNTMADMVKRPSDVVHLNRYVAPNNDLVLNEVDDEGADQGGFLIPNRMVLVIRTVTITPNTTAAGSNRISLRQLPDGGGAVTRILWEVPSDRTTQLQFSPGIVIAPRHYLRAWNLSSSTNTVDIDIFGYLTRDK